MSEAIDAPDARLEPLTRRFEALVAGRCFEAVVVYPAVPAFPSVAALRAFWDDGGFDWLADLVEAAPDADVAFPPDVRPMLTLETESASSPLRDWLCRERDEACGRETIGWTLRAERALGDHVLRERDVWSEFSPEAECADVARAEPEDSRFSVWVDCVSGRRRRTTALPLGRIRAPTRGWFVVAGRRGHYDFCDGRRAYDLATGALYLHEWCASRLAHASIPPNAPSVVGTPDTLVCIGRVPIDALREAVWMNLIGLRADESHAPFVSLPLPSGISRVVDPEAVAYVGGLSLSGVVGSTHQTRLSWSVVVDDSIRTTGYLTWPDSTRAIDDHAAMLLEIAEAAIVPGCDPTWPTSIPVGRVPTRP